MKLGTIDIVTGYTGNTEWSKVMLGTTQIWVKESGPDYTIPFYIEDVSGSDNTLTIKKSNSSASTLAIEKSTDKVNWSSMGSTSTSGVTATVPANGKLYLRCSTDAWGKYAGSWSYYYNTIQCSGRHNVGGNIMSLLYGSNFTGEETTFPSGSTYTFYNLFNGVKTLVSAENLLLSAMVLTNYCYQYLFNGCSSLTTPPALPSTSLAIGCYNGLFYKCTSLTTAPALPSTSLAYRCYYVLFSGCSSLTTAPELPATSLAQYCYYYMFNGCTSLNYIKVGFSAWPNMSSGSASDYMATNYWTELGVNTTGTFVCPAALSQEFNASGNKSGGTSSISGYTNAIPYGWTVQTY